jgi:hypothetical protein
MNETVKAPAAYIVVGKLPRELQNKDWNHVREVHFVTSDRKAALDFVDTKMMLAVEHVEEVIHLVVESVEGESVVRTEHFYSSDWYSKKVAV